MAGYLVDTNIWSETLRNEPDPLVVQWMRQYEDRLYISAITIGELKFGIERLEEGRRKRACQEWLSTLTHRMKGKVLNYNTSVATVWGQLLAKCERDGVRLPSLDSQLAATAIRHSLTVATRNEKDFKHSGVKVENPFVS